MGMPDDSFFRHLCRDAGVALIATDPELSICFWNSAASRFFGGSSEAMIGQPLVSVVPAEQRELATRYFERTIREGEVAEFDFAHRGPSGEPMMLAITVSPVVDEAGTTLGLSVHVRNVTRRLEHERQIAATRKMSALGTMAGGIAHHFNNVIGGVITSIDFAQTSDDPQFVRRLLGSAITALSRASKLTQSLLIFAEGDQRDTQTASLVETIRESLAPLSGPMARQGIKLETSLEPLDVAFPLKRIQTILQNLTNNALEAMPKGGTLRIQLSRQGSQVVLTLSDTGVGIQNENLSRLFEPFFTTKSPQCNDTISHTGLGLAVVHGLIRDLGGTILVASEPDKGTTIVVRLPYSPSSQTQ
jgi:PAS domain S-box-containing protein